MPEILWNIGLHSIACGDLTTGATELVMQKDLADVIYTDPPWGPGLHTFFHTKAGIEPKTSWPDFLKSLSETCAKYRKKEAPVFIEMGLKWVLALHQAMHEVGLEPLRQWTVYYGPKSSPRPNSLTLFGVDLDITLPDPPCGEVVTKQVLRSVVKPGMLVLDPCAGLGMTARSTLACKGLFRGVELVQDRAERTASWIMKHL